jgi:integrase
MPARWTDIDMDSGVWTKPLSVKEKQEAEIHLSPPAIALLREHYKARAADDAFVFPGLTYDAIRDDWRQLLDAARIANLRRHDWRHTFASFVLSSGFGLSEVGAMLGHTQAQTTQRYAHLLDDRLRAAADAAGKALSGK